MDRDERREIRKRGAASRRLATDDDDDIVIKTPKWLPVSQDPGALITEEMSLEHSPLYQRQYQSQPELRGQRLSFPSPKYIDPALLSNRTPRTPQERIAHGYDPPSETSNRSIVSSRRTPAHRERYVEEGTSADLKKEMRKGKPKEKTVSKPKAKPREKKKKTKKQMKQPVSEYESDEYETARRTEPDDDLSSMDEFMLDEDEDDEDASGAAPTIEISRLPTSSSRLTSIDLVLHYLRYQTPDSAVFDVFKELNETMFSEILDLNLVNNHYVYSLRDLKLDKQDLRQQILERRNQVSEQLAKLEKLRADYNKVRTLLAAKWRISNKLKRLKDAEDNEQTAAIMEKLNKLNGVLDPNWSLVDKLQALNDKLHQVDRTLSK